MKGPSVFQRYHNDPGATAACFTEDGWFRTGDLGSLDRDGYVTITGRAKEIIVTAGGKKVKVMECRVAESHGEAAGTVLATKPLTVACADGAIQLLHVVPEGKKPMDGTSFAAGLRLKAGDTL